MSSIALRGKEREMVVKFTVLILMLAVLVGCGGGGGGEATVATNNPAFGAVMLSFDEISGTTAFNSNSGNFNATIYGANRVAGKVNNALHFGTGGARAEISVLSLRRWQLGKMHV